MGPGSPRVLVVQARRRDDPMLAQEQECFVRATGLARERLAFHDLCAGAPRPADLRGHDALMVGGAGDFYVSRPEQPWFEPFCDLLRDVAGRGFPTFASCYGFQAMVVALGGTVAHDPASTEVGTYALHLTEQGAADELFGRLPAAFPAQMGHKDRAERLPGGVVNLARSDLCAYQALRIPGRPVWATQFHPELDERTNRERFLAYLAGYRERGIDPAATLRRFAPSPAASSLLAPFLALVFGR